MRWLAVCRLHRCVEGGQAPRRVRLEVATAAAGRHVVDDHLRQLGVERELLRAVSAQWDRVARSAAHGMPVWIAVELDRLVVSGTPNLLTDEPAARRVEALFDAVRGRYGARALLWGERRDPYAPYTGAKIAYQSFPDLVRLRWLGVLPRPRVVSPDRRGALRERHSPVSSETDPAVSL